METMLCRSLSAADQSSFNDLLATRSVPVTQVGAQRYGAFESDDLLAAVGIGQSDSRNVVLFDLYVKPSERGRGVASCLVKWIKDEYLPRASAILLTVRSDNHAALHLYRRMGFHVTGNEGEELRMCCQLNSA